MSNSSPIALRLTDAIKSHVNGALGRGKPVAVSYIDERQQPHMSFRGTVQTYGDSQLAFWARDPVGGIAGVIAHNPALALLYGDFGSERPAFLAFRGRGRIDNDASVRSAVFENSHPLEQDQDKERKGVAIIVDLDTVSGLVDGGFINLTRE